MDQVSVAALITASRSVADAISFDMNGVVIGGRFVGGNGGLISVDTLKKVDEMRRAISAIEEDGQ